MRFSSESIPWVADYAPDLIAFSGALIGLRDRTFDLLEDRIIFAGGPPFAITGAPPLAGGLRANRA